MKKKILVVDNNSIVLEFMKDLLTQEGRQVLTAEDGLSALDILKTFTPDIIFVDLIMPNIEGEKLCQIIRRVPELKDVPAKDIHNWYDANGNYGKDVSTNPAPIVDYKTAKEEMIQMYKKGSK